MSSDRFRTQPLDTRQLLAFVTVGRTLSFTQAGKELFVTQSAVSHAVKALEEEVGQRLLDRNGKKLRVTPAGEHLLHYAEKVLSIMAEARSALMQRERWQADRLRIAAEESFCSALMPGILTSFRRQFREMQISVRTGDTRECVTWIEQDEIDLAIAIAPSRAEPVDVWPLFSDEVVWIVSADHSWVRSGGAVPAEIAAESYICTRADNYTSQLLRNHLERDGIRMQSEQEVGSLEAVRELVKDGAGVAALAAWSVNADLVDGSLATVPLGKRKLKRNWALLRPVDRKANLLSETFSKFAAEATGAAIMLANTLPV